MFDHNSLYADIVRMWGENGAHAEIFRDICKKAELEVKLEAVESMDDKIRRIYKEEGENKLLTIKRIRSEEETYMSLGAAKDLVHKVVG